MHLMRALDTNETNALADAVDKSLLDAALDMLNHLHFQRRATTGPWIATPYCKLPGDALHLHETSAPYGVPL